ncbi:hypothetical protein VT72_02605 [Clostridium botulinum]|uniref:Uncharacterized protein n=1 Tax=Clostridium botulinum (strain Langeland / NCTC 10281 / Type F) TaxID=441772 RepID=A7GFB4_CLOBL|nr:hypothetical protein CLI_2224 [Clostridium botulinum F str. Langeland]ADF99876.1 hypothetical protein CBF_2209 [Clostridium botulinum F str. 230613]KKM42550.1 hypothetical protein VT72_02605 [Clostridium botulinum]
MWLKRTLIPLSIGLGVFYFNLNLIIVLAYIKATLKVS